MADARGATVSRKTIALAAIEERRVTFTLGPGWTVDGYLCGMDDYHYKVVQPGRVVSLVHKAHAVVTIYEDGQTLRDLSQEEQDELRPIIVPFKEAMEADRRRSSQDAQGATA